MRHLPRQPLAEVFGFPIDNLSEDASRFRRDRLCPFNNRLPNCTKTSTADPLGVCSVHGPSGPTITCPVRFRQDWLVASDASRFFFPVGARWTSLTEVRVTDALGGRAGNIDLVLVEYDDGGHVVDFGAVEVQSVYISGNVRDPFRYYMTDPAGRADMDWTGRPKYPRPDYLSSTRKRLAPQLLYKGGILNGWGKKLAVAVHTGLFVTLPGLEHVPPDDADTVWLVYDLVLEPSDNRYRLVLTTSVYTRFQAALETITMAQAGQVEEFTGRLQMKLSAKLRGLDAADDSPPTLPADAE